MRDEAAASLRALTEVVERLRAPGGCPWDREQTHRTLSPYLLEEAHEVLEAIDGGSPEALREELGDVLLQVLMHCAIAAEAGDGEGFDIGDVAEITRAKMVRRHPHVFADESVSGPEHVVVNWERIKAGEKRGRLSLLEGVPRTLPALARTQGIQKRPARVGFDLTPGREGAAAAVREALDRISQLASAAGPEVASAAPLPPGAHPPQPPPGTHPPAPPPPPAALEESVGELLFAVVALSRRLRVNAEDALRRRTEVFARRFAALEAAARADGIDLHDLTGEEWRRRWEAAAPPLAG